MEKVVRIFKSFEEADRADREFYASLTPIERLNMQSVLIEQSKIFYDDPPTRLERVYRVTQLRQG